jgi:hypothetical protein
LKDARGLEGEDFAYRLTIREPNPDFTLTASPSNVNVPLGGRVPITVTADRRLGYQGAIDLEIEGPSDVSASPATILTGQDSTVVTPSLPFKRSPKQGAFRGEMERKVSASRFFTTDSVLAKHRSSKVGDAVP